MKNELKDYLASKFTQYFRINGMELSEQEVKDFTKAQIEGQTDLLKGFIREALAAGC